jgi:hypothetical protein
VLGAKSRAARGYAFCVRVRPPKAATPMSDLYPIEALDDPVMNLADVIRHDLDDTLISNDAGETHGV